MVEKVDLGATGLEVSRLCFGTGTSGWNHRSNQSDLGIEGLAELLLFAHEHGVSFWDVADQYGTHAHVAAALEKLERDSVTITTKTYSRSATEVRQDIERFLVELNTDYIDIVLLHCLTDPDWPDILQGPMDVLSDYKSRGRIGAVGVSCHDFGAFQTTAETDWVDVVLARINYAGHAMDAAPDKVIPVIDKMAAAGKGIYGMKVVGGGSDLTQDPARAVRFVLEIPSVHALVLGMMNREEVLENIGLVGELALA